jgi:two-component system chemotaxis response regulator CheB
MKKIRVLIIEDSHVVRQLLEHLIRADPRLEVAGSAASGEEGLRLLHTVEPDVISMDIRLPGMNGFEATQRIMSERPTPIVVVSASVEAEDLHISLNALRAGALAVVEKPVGMLHRDYEALANRLCTQLVLMSQVKVVRQRGRGPRFEPGGSEGRASAAVAGRLEHEGAAIRTFRLLGLVASTGGPQALAAFLGALPASFPLPIALVQHITPSFLDGFVAWLGTVCPFAVVLAQEGDWARPGRVYVPPVDHHLCVEGTVLRLDRSEPVCVQRPSGTVLFRSMARTLGSRALAVLLTGMGEDGAEGMAEVRAAGGYTIAEDEATAVVYGMPGAAVRLGAVCETLPLPAIAGRVLALVANGGG